jgi:hypothetical protein
VLSAFLLQVVLGIWLRRKNTPEEGRPPRLIAEAAKLCFYELRYLAIL